VAREIIAIAFAVHQPSFTPTEHLGVHKATQGFVSKYRAFTSQIQEGLDTPASPATATRYLRVHVLVEAIGVLDARTTTMWLTDKYMRSYCTITQQYYEPHVRVHGLELV
jgi:hypothetical protein